MATRSAGDQDATRKLIDSARAMGVEIDRGEAERWVRALSIEPGDGPDTGTIPLGNARRHQASLSSDDPTALELARSAAGDAVATYVEELTEEVYHYTVRQPNFGKAARRMYNIFRLTGRRDEAEAIRGIFDAPTTALYQAAAVLRTLNVGVEGHATVDGDVLVAQVDRLIMSAIGALDGRAEAEIVRRLLAIRDELARRSRSGAQGDAIAPLREAAFEAVNDYFEGALTAIPSINGYLKSVAATRGVPTR